MNAFWVSLKENVSCGTRLTDVARQSVKLGKENSNINNNRDNNGHSNPAESQASLVVTTTSIIPPRLQELSIGDPSRKIVELIFHKGWMNTSTPLKKVKRVYKVSSSPEMLESFEKYREMVKKKACEQNPKHPRSIVDGNELLRFYDTTMRCCQGKSVQKVKDLCNDPSCCVCQVIQFNFDTQFSRMTATRLKTERSAVIVCRIIAGNAMHEVNGEIEGSYSNRVGEMQFSLEKFVVRNPSAILPCFVIVFS